MNALAPIQADADPVSGIVQIFRFAPDGTATAVPRETVSEAIADPGPGWIWVHLGLSDNRCRMWIAQSAPLSDLAREVLTSPERHLRLDVLGDEIVGVVPDLHQEFARPGDDLVRLRFAMTGRMLITARQRPVQSIEYTLRAMKAGKLFPTPASFFDAVIDQFADTISRMAERLGAELDEAEDHVMNDEPADERQKLGRVRLEAVRVHRQLAQLRSLFYRIEPRLAGNAAIATVIRGLAQKLDGIDHDAASLHERARMLLDEMDSKLVSITNKRLFTLSILTACLMPPTLVTGFFGMNTKDMPFQNSDAGTWFAGAVSLAAALVCYWALRRLRAF